MEINHLFPTPVIRQAIGGLEPAEAQAITDLAGGYVSNVGNVTSVGRTILQDARLARLADTIDQALANYLAATIAPRDGVSFRVTQSWLNVTTQNQFHHRHYHQNSVVSGVYYIEAEGDDRIMFHRPGVSVLEFQPQEWNPYNSQTWWLPVKTGDLLLFPSTLEHSVPNLQTDTRRVSLAFNTWFDGEAGQMANLTHLASSLAAPYAPKSRDDSSAESR